MFFSIAISAYKGKYLKEAIGSILSQTYKDFELIILNDCSPESISSIVSEFDDTRLQYFENKVNVGAEHLVNNWNNCLSKAKGQYFIMMGDDDVMNAIYLEEFTRLIAKYPELDVYHCRSMIIDEKSKPVKLTPSWPEFENVYENMWHRIMGYRLQYISDFVYNTKALKIKGGFFFLPLAWGADDITSYIACSTKGIAHTNKPVFNYRHSQYTITSSNSHEKIAALVLREKWTKEFLRRIPDEKEDQILYFDLKTNYKMHYKKQKIFVMAQGLKANFFKNFFFYANCLRSNELSFFDLIESAIKSLHNNH